ncbi:hypothetical protein CRM22_000717 [Opisthorchis felineus]|uniref:Uncharacterized protein n=1 Tax=Opisthorchis felineus TaxID=147828 RepID=A0A4S2ME43_OPIFE|nr:hypothetical protein CRM22_000717 [Opisthorchis felineus]
MSNSPRHPAFYTSRRQLWATLPSPKSTCCNRWLTRTGLGTNCTSLFDVWHALFTTGTVLWLIFNAIWRYGEVKAQAYHPRFGGGWNDIFTLNVQISAMIIALSLLPVLVYATTSRTGHLANDSVILGRDVMHLHKCLSSCEPLQGVWKSSVSGSAGNSLDRPVGQKSTRAGSFEDEELNKLILKRRRGTFYRKLADKFRPFSSVLYVVIVYILLFPVCLIETEQLRHEAIHPRFAISSKLDGLLGKPTLLTQVASDVFVLNAKSEPDKSAVDVTPPNERPFPGHPYPVDPADVCLEYALLAIGFCVLTVRYAGPFYFASRPFALLFSAYTATSGLFLLIDSATMDVLYKLAVVGVREPGGAILLDLGEADRTFSPFYCLILSASAWPVILINLMAVYAYGEAQFDRAISNYSQLLASGDLPVPCTYRSGTNSKPNCNGTIAVADCLTNNAQDLTNISFGTDNHLMDVQGEENFREAMHGLPITLAVTTKLWRPPPPPTSGRASRMAKRINTPIPGQYTSNGSEASGTIKRNHPQLNGTESADLTESVHTLTDLSGPGKTTSARRSYFGLLLVAACCFSWLLVSRICLAGPILRCYWKTGLSITLTNVLMTAFYLICWLLVWFGLGVKNAWRFRLLHTVHPVLERSNRFEVARKDTSAFSYPPEGTLLPIPTGYPTIWPYVTYAPWLTNGSHNNMTGGLPVSNPNEENTPVVNSNMNIIPEAGSGGDSLYGCFADVSHPTEPGSMVGRDQFHGQMPGIGLRVGPPTLSDESDGVPAPIERPRTDLGYVQTLAASESFPVGLTQSNSFQLSSQRSFSPNPFNIPGDVSSRETSPVEMMNMYTNGSRIKSQRISATQNVLLKSNGRHADGLEPTYATLASLSRPVRPPSVSSQLPDSREISPPVPLNRNLSCRRNGSRVTFKESESDHYRNQQDAATGSSDSGVYTNGHGSGPPINERQPRCGRLKPESLAPFANRSVMGARGNSVTPTEHGFYGAKDRRILEVEMHGDGNESPYMVNGQTTLSSSNDQLCSQV